MQADRQVEEQKVKITTVQHQATKEQAEENS